MITLIAAIDENHLIGRDDTIPWHIPADFKHFKETTLGYPIVMGRKTYDSLPKRPLPGRANIVVSRSKEIDGAQVYPDVMSAIEAGLSLNETIFIIGGQSIYEQTIDLADRLLITHIDGGYLGNYWFPRIGARWKAPTTLVEGDGFRIKEYFPVGDFTHP